MHEKSSNATGKLLAQCSETEIIDAFMPFLSAGADTLLGPGDDCAVIRADGSFVVSTDMLVSGTHFLPQWSTGFDVGARAAAQNLADIAAMGARPTSLVVGLSLPKDLPLTWLVDFARGLSERAEQAGAGVVGGDITVGPLLSICVTVHGDMQGRAPVTRAGARVGDTVALAGTLGMSRTGYELLVGGVTSQAHSEYCQIYRAPRPPLTAGIAASQAGAHAMMDVSDGLAQDGAKMAAASVVNMDLSRELLRPYMRQILPGVRECGRGETEAWRWVLSGGEDHALLATFAPGSVPDGFTPIGAVAEGAGLTLDGQPVQLQEKGWDPFARKEN